MTEAVVTFTADAVEDIVGELLFDDSSIQEHFKVEIVKKKVEEIKSELLMMRTFLIDIAADARQSKEERVRQWVSQIKALAYRIEDVIETYVINVESRNKKTIRESRKRSLKKPLVSKYIKRSVVDIVLSEIEDINKTFTNLKQHKETFQISDIGSSSSAIVPRDTFPSYYPMDDEKLLVGMEKDIDQLISSIFDPNENYQVISICGMVGLGKTALARKLYHHHRIRGYFVAFAWVEMTQESSTRDAFESIHDQLSLNRLTSMIGTRMEEMELIEQLRRFQKENRCLIILDHVPSTETWEKMRTALPLENNLSRMLITTRSIEVAERVAARNGKIHTMSLLTEDDAWDLFTTYLRRKYAAEPNDDSEEENIGRELVRRCKGMPLGILAIGEVFRVKTSQQWNMVLESGKLIEGMDKVLQALSSIYSKLPYHLRSCLLYLATFQKDTQINPEKLYHLWKAEGLISSGNHQSETMMHRAEKLLNELYVESIVDLQKEEVTTARRIKSCSLHYLMRDFCLFMGRQEEFFVVMKNELLKHEESDPFPWTDRTWRLVIYFGRHDNLKSLVHLNKKLRCLLVRNGQKQEMVTDETLSDLINCITQSTSLRTLDCDGINFGNQRLPEGIADLIHLRYISVKGCLLKALPASIGKLPYLQILDLRVRTGFEMEIPNVLHKMKRLRHLYLPLTFKPVGSVKLRLDGLTQLETLENFNSKVCDVEDLVELTNLWYITIIVEGSLEDLKRLVDLMNRNSASVLYSSLDVRNFDCYTEERHLVFRKLLASPALRVLYMEGHLFDIPIHREISVNLTQIKFSGSQLKFDPMRILENLPDLRVLVLYDDAFVVKEISCSASKFPELRYLELSNLRDLESWKVETAMPALSSSVNERAMPASTSEIRRAMPALSTSEIERAMPKLSTLVIENCSKLKMLPDGLQFLTNLRELKILTMPETFKIEMYKVPPETSVIFDN